VYLNEDEQHINAPYRHLDRYLTRALCEHYSPFLACREILPNQGTWEDVAIMVRIFDDLSCIEEGKVFATGIGG